MQRNTITYLDNLRIGDRFHLRDVKKEVWEVVSQDGTYTKINRPHAPGFPVYKSKDKLVMFLRHTIPLEGEECQAGDLKKGDVFFQPNDIVAEYVVTGRERSFVIAKPIVGFGEAMIKPNTIVVFVRKKEAKV